MARVAKSFEDKVASLLEKDLTSTQEAFCDWLEEKTGADIDRDTLKLVQSLYQDYTKDPEVAAANAERKAANEAKAEERKSKSIERARKLLEAAGLEVVPAAK